MQGKIKARHIAKQETEAKQLLKRAGPGQYEASLARRHAIK